MKNEFAVIIAREKQIPGNANLRLILFSRVAADIDTHSQIIEDY